MCGKGKEFNVKDRLDICKKETDGKRGRNRKREWDRE